MMLPLLFTLTVGAELDLPNRIGVIVPSGERDYRDRLEFDLNEILLNMGRFRVVSTGDLRSALPHAYPTDCWGVDTRKFNTLRDSLKIDYLVLACLSRLDSYWDSYRDTLGHLRDFVKAEVTVYLRILNLEDQKTVLSVMVSGSSADTAVTSRAEGLDNAYKDCIGDIKWHLKQFFVLRGTVTEKDRRHFVITVGEEVGAQEKMKFQVLKNKHRIGFLEITTIDVGKSWAQAITGRKKIRPGDEVKELPFGLTFCELTPTYLNAPVTASPNDSFPTEGVSRINSFGPEFGVGRVWHLQGGFNYGYGEKLHLVRTAVAVSYRLPIIEDNLWGYLGMTAEPGLAIQSFRADTLLFEDSTGTTNKLFFTGGPRAGFKIRFGAYGIDIAGGYLFKNNLSNWEYSKTINKVHYSHPLKSEWLGHPEVTIGGWEIMVGLSYNFEIY
jgi:hypothetical protein